jgi:hypothetical protein
MYSGCHQDHLPKTGYYPTDFQKLILQLDGGELVRENLAAGQG